MPVNPPAGNPEFPPPFILGVAGAIGAGKSAVAQSFASLGCVVVDFDAEAKAALDRKDVRRRLIEWWGIDMIAPTGLVDRAAVARVIFANDAARMRLERLVHPLIWRTRNEARAEAMRAGTPGIILDAPLLFETGLVDSCDAVVFVDAPEALRLERLKARGWTREELARRERAQMPTAEKRRLARFEITNDGSMENLRGQVGTLFDILCGHAKPGAGR
ncbi:MAG: dephospho-CoA kinase [Phycisphaerales bacterium]|nr:dephospho-CoA kinase [Phycisphaerales bacterium]